MTDEPVRVLIVDDHSLVLDGLTARLRRSSGIDVVGQAMNGRDGIAEAERLLPDVVLMDINMPDVTGIEAAEILAEGSPECALIILSVHDDREYILDAARAGAKGYLLKSASAEDMVQAIETVHAGGTFYSPEIAEILLQQPRDSVPLTHREQTIIGLLANGMSSRDMAAKLNISVRTVETHRRNIKQKLNVNSTPALVRYAIEYGLTQ